MRAQTILMIFTIICISSCCFVTPMPRHEIIEICPPVFVPVDPDNSIYKVHCRCADYNMNNGEFVSDFIKAPVLKCDRAYAIPTEDFLEKVEPTLKEIKEWYADELQKQEVMKKAIKKRKKSQKTI